MSVGPQSGRFIGVPYTPGGPVPPRPEVIAVQAKSVTDPTLGVILLAVATVPAQQQWLLRRITVQCSVSVRAYVYVGDVQPQNLVSGTNSGDFDEDDVNSPIFVPEGSKVSVIWLTTLVTATALVRLEYNDVS